MTFTKPSVADIIAVLVAVVALGTSVFAYRLSAEAVHSTARSEIVGYAERMVSLDRLADVRNANQITVLGEQAEIVINKFGQDNLELTASTYRILGQFLSLDTDNLELAHKFASTAFELAREKSNVIEQIRASRVLADIAAQNGDVEVMRAHYFEALQTARAYNKSIGRTAVVTDSVSYTGVFAIYTSLYAARNGGGAKACAAAREYFRVHKDDLDRLLRIESLEVARRVDRIYADSASAVCNLQPNSELRLDRWHNIWDDRDKSSGG